MKQKVILPLLMIAGSLQGQTNPHIITFFIRPLPVSTTTELQTALERYARMPLMGKAAKPSFINPINPPLLHSGIYVAYAGMVTHTDPDGQILFERKTAEPKLNVLITEEIKPIAIDPVNSKTLYGFIVDPKAQAQQFLVERLKDPETELYSWYISQKPVIKDKRIPYDTIIIFANPKHVIVPLGPTATTVSENFLLPDFYVTAGHNSAANALRFLKIRQYFATTAFDYKFLPDEFQKKILP
jgi:hypothetical protein